MSEIGNPFNCPKHKLLNELRWFRCAAAYFRSIAGRRIPTIDSYAMNVRDLIDNLLLDVYYNNRGEKYQDLTPRIRALVENFEVTYRDCQKEARGSFVRFYISVDPDFELAMQRRYSCEEYFREKSIEQRVKPKDLAELGARYTLHSPYHTGDIFSIIQSSLSSALEDEMGSRPEYRLTMQEGEVL